MRVAFLGDTHANTGPTLEVIEAVARAGVNTIVQCGDFGFWPRFPSGQKFLRKVSKKCQEYDITLHWADGNHEDHSKLPHHQVDPWEHHPNIVWHPRGTTSTFWDKKFLWLGGAVSVDKYHRTPGHDWFHNEIPDQEQWDRALTAGPVDVLITHDAPNGVSLRGMPGVLDELERASAHMRFGISSVIETTNPRLVVHGHWHQRLTTLTPERLILSLGYDYNPLRERGLIFDLDALDQWGSGEPPMANVGYFA